MAKGIQGKMTVKELRGHDRFLSAKRKRWESIYESYLFERTRKLFLG